MPGIEFQELAFRNAFTYAKARIPLADQGLVLVQGANGSAKSALFDVLRHVLLGQTARGTKGRDIVRAGQEDPYVAQLTFRRAGQQYRVRQTWGHPRDGNAVLVYRDDQLVSHQRAKVKTQKVVADELLGMTAQQFDASVLIGQEAAHPLVNGTGAECAQYLARTFGLDCYDDLRDRLREHIKARDLELAGLQHHEQEVKRLGARLAELGPDPEAAARSAQELAKAADQRDQKARARLDRAERDCRQADQRARLLARAGDQPADQVAREIAALDGTIKKLEARVRQNDQRANAKAQRERLEAGLRALPEPPDVPDVQALRAELDDLQARRDPLVRRAGLLDQLDRLDGRPDCPTCGQPVDHEHVADEARKAQVARDRLTKLDARSREIKNEIDQAARQARERDGILDRGRVLRDQLAGLPEDAGPPEDSRELAGRLDRARRARDDLVIRLEAARDLAELPDVDPEVARSERDAWAIRSETARMNAREAAVAARVAQDRAQEAVKVQALLQEAQAQLDRWAAGRRDQARRKALHRALAKLKVRRLHEVVRSIQQVLPEYVQAMWSGAPVTIEVDDRDPESIDRSCVRPGPGGPVRVPVRALSKGERARLRVACVLAVRALASPDRSANILVLDEADGGLDLAGLEAYGQLLEGLRDQYGSVFVVSHRKELSTVRFDRVWRVRKDDSGQSSVEIS